MIKPLYYIEEKAGNNKLTLYCEKQIFNDSRFVEAYKVILDIFNESVDVQTEEVKTNKSDTNLSNFCMLLELIREEREKYPFSLSWEHVMELLDISKPTVYKKLKAGEIPGAKYIDGIGWRVNRDLFLTWLYCGEVDFPIL